MKKIIIFLLSYFLLGSFSVSANRYWAHPVWHGASWVTSCNQDGQWVAWICAQIWWVPAVWTAWACPHPWETWSWTAPTWNMTCLYWDQEVPTVTTTYPTNVWRNWTQTIILTSSDTWWSWIASTKWCEWAWCTPSTTYVSGITKTWNYVDTIRFQTWDVAGNASAIWSIIVKIDNTLPTVTDNYTSDNIWSNSWSKTVTLSPIDDIWGSWISTTKRCIWSACDPSTWTWATTFTINANFNNTVRYQTWDIANNSSAIWSIIVKLDTTIPTITDNYAYDNIWINWTRTITLNPVDTWWSLIASTKRCVWTVCNPSTWTWASTITIGGNFNNTIRYQTWDTAWNASTIWSVIVKIDNTSPTVVTNITSIIPNNWSNLLADNAKNFQIITNSGWGSPITSLLVYFEDYNSTNSFKATSNECISSCIQNIQNVDNSLTPDWWRDYSLRISQICDEAWNCTWDWNQSTNLITYTYHVFSDISDINWQVVTNELTNSSNIADWTEKNLTINLKDWFGNKIVPLTSIWRNITFNFNTDNDLYLDEHLKTWNWVYLNTTTDTSTYSNRISIWPDTTPFPNQTSFDWNWNYNYKFKVYTPTKNVYDKAFWNLVFWSILVNVSDSIWSNLNTPISNSTFDARFLPIYQTAISWGIKDDWMIDWTVQSSNITISKNSTVIIPSLKKLYVEFWSWDTNSINTKYDLYHWTGSANNLTWEWSNYTVYKDDAMFSPIMYSIFTKLTPTWWTLSDIQNSYFSTHIWYTLDWKNVVNNWDVFWKDNYWGPVWTWWTYASVLKVIWKTYTQSFTEILEDQAVNEVNLLNWMITKSSLKTEVRRNAYNIIRNTTETNSWNTINNSNFLNNVDWAKLLNWNILYFGWLEWKNVTLNSLTFEWNKTILVEWWNLYITWDIDVMGYKSLLSIVVLKDINWNWWNVYIKPNVKSIKSIIYADKSLMSAEDTNWDWIMQVSEEHDWNTWFATLRNQLYIYGSVFSENTIWWSRATPLKCPYYVSSCVDQDLAQKYDLNYLRRYYLKDTNNDWIWDTPAWWWASVFPYPLPNSKYPVVIEYNPLIQTDTPLIFMN